MVKQQDQDTQIRQSHLQVQIIYATGSARIPYVSASLILGQAKLIHSLSSEIFQKAMRAGGHFSYFIVQLIALLK